MDEPRQAALIALGSYLTGTEAEELADLLDNGETLSQAFDAIQESRRSRVRELFTMSGYGIADDTQRRETVAGLRGIQGAHTRASSTGIVWTAPMGQARLGDLNSSRDHLVRDARTSIVCSTYNFQRSSALWKALVEASHRPEISIRIYIDNDANTDGADGNSPTPEDIARSIIGATVFRTRTDSSGRHYRNHAKFLAIDHQVVLVTSANFSYSAEERNIELGLRLEDRNLTELIERQMREFERNLYEQVKPQRR